MDSSGGLVERVTYDAYGQARHHYRSDIVGDGGVGTADANAMTASLNKSIGDAAYNVDADIDRSGTVDSADQSILNADNPTTALAKGLLSDQSVDNQIGWDGYVFNAETRQYTVRFRCYDPVLGRWLTRDPVVYSDGMNLHSYVGGSPAVDLDPSGLHGFAISRNKKTNCKTEKTGESCWKFDKQQVAVGYKPNLPGLWWQELGAIAFGLFLDNTMVQWHPMGRYGDALGPQSLGSTCRCRFRKYEEECTTCCVQHQHLKPNMMIPNSPYWENIGPSEEKTKCDFYPTGKTVETYGTVMIKDFGARGYQCTCLTPDHERSIILEFLEFGGRIPDDQVGALLRRARELESSGRERCRRQKLK